MLALIAAQVHINNNTIIFLLGFLTKIVCYFSVTSTNVLTREEILAKNII